MKADDGGGLIHVASSLTFNAQARAAKASRPKRTLRVRKRARGRLQRTSAKISDFQTTPSLCPGVSEFPKPPPLPGRPRPDFSIFTHFYFCSLNQRIVISIHNYLIKYLSINLIIACIILFNLKTILK